jgi:hypothetical protein
MEAQSLERPRIPLLTTDEVLAVLRARWPEALTPNEIFFAARPEFRDDGSISGSAYARPSVNTLRDAGDLVADGKSGRSQLFRVKHKPLTSTGQAGLDVHAVPHAAATVVPPAAEVATPAAPPKPEAAAVRDDPDPIATILLGMARAPKPGSRIDIVKVQALEGITWARAAGWTDLRIAQEIIEASGLDARPEDIRKLVSSIPGSPPRLAAPVQQR